MIRNYLCCALLGLISVVTYAEENWPREIRASEYPTVQAALDALPEEGGIVHLPPGTVEIVEPLEIHTADTCLRGSGPSTHIVNKNEKGQPALIVSPQEYENDSSKRIWRLHLQDFRVSGNPESGDGILAQGINEILVHGVSIDHNGGHGLNLVDCYENPRIVDSMFTYNQKAGVNILRGHDIVVNANQFEENEDGLRCIDSFNLCMNGNNLDDHLRHGVVIENTYGSVLSGNMIEECQGMAMVLDRDCYGITMSANVIAHNVQGGVEFRDAWGCALSANTFTINDHRSVVVGSDSGRITITGNNISNAHIGGETKRDDPAGGILLVDTCDIVITGNVFADLINDPIEQKGECENILISDNITTGYSKKP